jgi:hypothetical protein
MLTVYFFDIEGVVQGRRVHGCGGGSIASLLKNETKIFLPIFDLEKIFYTSKY